MRWFKILADSVVVGAEAHEDPMFVRRLKNGVIDLCDDTKAEGITSLDQTCYYQLDGRKSLGVDDGLTAVEISGVEYDELVRELPDPEDNDPEVPDGSAPEHIPSRAELAERVSNLEDKLLAAEILLGVAE